MKQVSYGQILSALRSVGLRNGDGVLVHSALQFLGRPDGGVEIYHRALLEVLGPRGTIAVPTFNFAFARGEPFDPETTPSDRMGTFAEYVRRRPDALRSRHPMQSLAVVGAHAADLAARDTPSAFDRDSAFDRMLELGFQVLLLGADIKAVSMVHHSEQRAGVPYRFWKDFPGRVRTAAGWQQRSYRMYVRDLVRNPRLTLAAVQRTLERRGQWHAVPLNYGRIARFRMADYVAVIDEMLAADPWSLVIKQGQS